LEVRRLQVAPEVARLEQAQTGREAFLVEHPDVPGRISDLSRSIEAREQLNLAVKRARRGLVTAG
jgi:hypothetical protein